jgi:hypothetical protein
MQLHLETDELNFLADLLMEPAGEKPRSPTDDRLLEMVVARDLRFASDELERVAELLVAHEHAMKENLARETNAGPKTELQRNLALLERLLEKVDEACVMI